MVDRNNTHFYDYTFDRAIATVSNLWNMLLNCWLVRLLTQSSNLLSSFTAVSLSRVMGVVSDRYTLDQCPAHCRVDILEQPFTASHNLRLIQSNQFTHHQPASAPRENLRRRMENMQTPCRKAPDLKHVILVVLTTQPLQHHGFFKFTTNKETGKMTLIDRLKL